VDKAVDRSTAQTYTGHQQEEGDEGGKEKKRTKFKQDKRNLYLANEGYVREDETQVRRG